AIFVGEQAAGPDAGRLLEIRHPDVPAVEVLRAVDPRRLADIDRRVAEGPGDEGRDRNIGAVAARRRDQVRAERQLRDVELLMPEGTLEDLLRPADDDVDPAAFDRHAPVDDRTVAVDVLAGERELQHSG